MKQILKKTTTMLLALAMIVSFAVYDFGSVVYAGEGPVNVDNDQDLAYYLEDGVNREIILDCDIHVEKSIEVKSFAMSIDLNGHTLYLSEPILLGVNYSDGGLYIKDSTWNSGAISAEKEMFILGNHNLDTLARLDIKNGKFYGSNSPMIVVETQTDYDFTRSGLYIRDGFFRGNGGIIQAKNSGDPNKKAFIEISDGTFESKDEPCILSETETSTIIGSGSFFSKSSYAILIDTTTDEGRPSRFADSCTVAYIDGRPYDVSFDYSYSVPYRRADYMALGTHELFQIGENSNSFANLDVSVNDENRGSVIVLNGSKARVSGTVCVLAIPKDSYSFIGWANKNGDILCDTEEYQFIMPDGNKSLCAVFSDCIHSETMTTIKTTKATSLADGTNTFVSKCLECGKIISEKDFMIPKIKSVKLKTTSYTYSGKAKTPSVVALDREGNEITRDMGYNVTYQTGRKAVGTYKVTVKFNEMYSGSKTLTFKINPKKAAISTLTPGTKKLTVKMSTKVSSTGGSTYKIGYKVSGSSTWKYTTTTSQSKTIKELKKGKKYKVKVRAYKKVNGKTYYGAWSTTKASGKIK